jgi:hypothetical protein
VSKPRTEFYSKGLQAKIESHPIAESGNATAILRGEIAMKRMTSIVFCVVASFVTAGTGLVQSYAVRANVGRAWLPAGNYVISEMSPQQIAIRSGDSGHAVALSLVQPDNTSTMTQGKLVFHKIGSRYFLSMIDCPAASLTASLPTSKLEQKARAHMEEASIGHAEQVLVALNR